MEQKTASMALEARKTPRGQPDLKIANILMIEPPIDLAPLKKIAAPALILFSDHNLIRLGHTFVFMTPCLMLS